MAAGSMPVSDRLPGNALGEKRYVEMKRRLTKATVTGAFAIWTLVTLSQWGNPRIFSLLLGVQLLQVPFNLWVNLRLLRRLGARNGELVRASVNIATSVLIGHVAHWPLPSWLWLPFVALAFDELGVQLASMMLFSLCAAFDVLALLDGVSAIYPISFTVLAVFCARISKVRVEEMSAMLLGGDVQRRQVERAHAALIETHERLTSETEARKLVELELRQAQKLEAVGRLAAGIAHEINTPVQFVGDNLRFTRDSLIDLIALVERYRSILKAVGDGAPVAEGIALASEAEQTADLAFLASEVPGALDRSREGIQRIAGIVHSIKEFAQADQRAMAQVDLNAAVANVLAIARNEYGHAAVLDVALAPLPPVVCHAGEINQVLLNLIVNAAHAIAEAHKETKGRISIRTAMDPDEKHVTVSVADDGAGIAEAAQPRIFEPFFTTKVVGKGIGQGLAVSRAVVQRHRGSLNFESKEGVGTTFYMRLPIAQSTERTPD